MLVGNYDLQFMKHEFSFLTGVLCNKGKSRMEHMEATGTLTF